MAFAAVMHGGEGIADGAFGSVFDGAGEDFAIGKILMAVAVDPAASLDGEFEVGVFSDDAHFAGGVEEIGEALLAFGDFFPGGDGVGQVEQTAAEDEVFVVA